MLSFVKTLLYFLLTPYGALMSSHFLSTSVSEKSKAETKWVICFSLFFTAWDNVEVLITRLHWVLTNNSVQTDVCQTQLQKASTNKVKLAIRSDNEIILFLEYSFMKSLFPGLLLFSSSKLIQTPSHSLQMTYIPFSEWAHWINSPLY